MVSPTLHEHCKEEEISIGRGRMGNPNLNFFISIFFFNKQLKQHYEFNFFSLSINQFRSQCIGLILCLFMSNRFQYNRCAMQNLYTLSTAEFLRHTCQQFYVLIVIIKCLSYSEISAILCFLFSVFTLFYSILENMSTNGRKSRPCYI